MNKLGWLRMTNLFLLVSAGIQAVTGIILFFGLDIYPASMAELHEWNGLVLIVLVAIHFYLNWGWIKSNYFVKKAA